MDWEVAHLRKLGTKLIIRMSHVWARSAYRLAGNGLKEIV
jgi:hypothetical protein